MVELQIVVLVVAGSSPVGHPIPQIPSARLQRGASPLARDRLSLLESMDWHGRCWGHIAHGPDRRFVWPIAVSPGLQLLGAHSQG